MPALLAEQLIALTIDETSVQPVVLVIDDLHWADLATVKLWGRLARTAHQAPLLLIGVTRPIPQREDLFALRRAVDDEHRVQLGSLAQPAVAELVGTLAGGRPDTGLLRLAAGAAGNPLYLTEMLAALARSGAITVTPTGTAQLADGAVPDSLPAAIADRLGFVSAPTREVLRAAALLGVQFEITDLTAVLGQTVAALVPALDEARATRSADRFRRRPRVPAPADQGGALRRDARLGARGLAPRRRARARLGRGGAGPGGQAAPARAGRIGFSCPRAPRSVRSADRRDRASVQRDQPGHDGRGGLGHRDRASAGRPGLGPGSGPVDEWMMDWLAASADSLVGQAPAVAAELLAQAVASIPAGSAKHGWLAGRLADALYRTGDRTAAVRVAERALDLRRRPRPGGGPALDAGPVPDAGRLGGRVPHDPRPGALPRPTFSAKHRARLLVLAARTYQFVGELEAADREADAALASAQEVDDAWATGWALHVLAIGATIRWRPDRGAAAL